MKKRKDEYVKVCPRCKSPDVSLDKSNPVQFAAGLPAFYVCNRCGHTANTFPEVRLDEIEEFKKQAAEKKAVKSREKSTPMVDKRYGEFMVEIVWKLTGPLGIAAGILFILMKDYLAAAVITSSSLAISYLAFRKK
jgi:hypothetical protein